MKKLFLLVLISTLGNAEYLGGKTPKATYGATYIMFGIDSPPSATTCDNWGRQMRFNATTPAGKNMYSMLLTAIASKRKIDLWYSKSTKPGTNRLTGCGLEQLAIVTAMGIR